MPDYAVIGLAVLAVAGAVFAAWPKLAKVEREWIPVVLGLLVVVGTTIAKTWNELDTQSENEKLVRYQEERRPEVDQASGAAVVGDRLYVVDDERATLALFTFDAEGDAKFERYLKVPPCSGTSVASDLLDDSFLDLSDLEAAAEHQGALLIATSHSRRRNTTEPPRPKRTMLAEIRFPAADAPCVGRHHSLYPFIDRLVATLPNGSTLAAMESDFNIEAIAADPRGRLFIGFRSPVIVKGRRPHGIVLVTTVNAALAGTAPASLRELQWPEPEELGITDMIFDASGSVVLLTNSTERDKPVEPRAWLWRDGEHPRATSWRYTLPAGSNAKPEALAFRGNDAYVFVDDDRFGGMRRFKRSDFGLQHRGVR